MYKRFRFYILSHIPIAILKYQLQHVQHKLSQEQAYSKMLAEQRLSGTNQLQQQNHNLKVQNLELRSQIQARELDARRYYQTAQHLRRQVNSQKRKVKDISKQNETGEDRNRKIVEENEELKEKLVRADAHINRLRQNYFDKQQYLKLEQNMEILQQAYDGLQDRLNNMGDKFNLRNSEYERLEQKYIRLQKQNNELTKTNSILETKYHKIEKDFDTSENIRNKLKLIKSKLATKDKKIKQLLSDQDKEFKKQYKQAIQQKENKLKLFHDDAIQQRTREYEQNQLAFTQ